jgi:predicted nucleic acid-binding protein
MSAEFVDTNVLVYAYDHSHEGKQRQAAELLERLWRDRAGVLSVQVLQELYVTLTRRSLAEDGRAIVSDFALQWQVVEPGAQDLLTAIDNAQQWAISFWDAMVVTTAIKAGSHVLWTEDLQHGRQYGDVLALNPFMAT